MKNLISKPAPPARRTTALLLFFLLLLTLCRASPYATTDIDSTKKFSPNLLVLNAPSDSAAAADTSGAVAIIRMFVADSARIVSPPHRAAVTACPVTCEVVPKMTVDSVKIFVRHSQNRIDTLGTVAAPPYRAAWDCGQVPDQDPAHLQFGYALYAPGVIIVSPPMPHHWALKRAVRKPTRERYSIRQQTAHAVFNIDGDRAKWGRAASGRIGDAQRNAGEFRMIWTGAKLYFAAWVNDTSVTSGDFVELHLDVHADAVDFPNMTHRSLRFTPLSRSMPFIGEYREGKGYVRGDSISQLFREEMVWRADVDSGRGYSIEAAIPHSLLSGFSELPPAKIGMDVTVMNVDRVTRGGNAEALFGDEDDGSEDTADASDGDRPALRAVKPIGAMIGRIEHDTAFYSWAGAQQYTRYSPSSWGTGKFARATPWFRVLFYLLIALAVVFPLLNIIQTFTSGRKEAEDDKLMDEDDYSPLTEGAIECVERGMEGAAFGLKDVAAALGASESEVAAALQKDMDITFGRLLSVRRVKRSQALMKDADLDIEKIAAMCGFADVNAYKEQYMALMNVDPEVSRAAVQERIREDRAAEEEEDDD